MAILTIKLNSAPSYRSTGTQQSNNQASWDIETDEVHACGHVIALAQELVGTLPTGQFRIPAKGDALAFSSANGQVYAGVLPSTVAAWVAADPSNRYADGGALALDEQCAPLEEGNAKNYRVTLTFRAPAPGRMERPGFLSQFASGLGTSLPLNTTAVTGGSTKKAPAVVVAALDPLTQPREIHSSYVIRDKPIRLVRPIVNGVAGDLTPLRNPNGVIYPPLAGTERIEIVTVEQNVRDSQFAHDLNAVFRDSINSDPITYRGQSIPKHHARFLVAESSRTRSQGGFEYDVLHYSVEIANEPYYEHIPARGPWFRKPNDETGRHTIVDDEGFQILEEYPLTSAGTYATPGNQHVDLVTRYNPVPYGNLLAGS